MATIKNVKELEAFNRAYQIALNIHKLTLKFPDYEKFSMASQIRRASKGICANIVEGFAKQHQSSAEFKRFLFMAVGSSEEMRLWLMFCVDLNYLTQEEYDKLESEYHEITKMLNGLIKNWK